MKKYGLLILFIIFIINIKIFSEDNDEIIALSKYKKIIKRNDDKLFITLKNGNTINLINNLEQDPKKYHIYKFIDYYKSYECLLLTDTGYEWFSYFLLNLNTGEKTYFKDKPILSPDSKYFVVCIGIMYIMAAIEIYEYKNNKFIKIYNNEDIEFYPFNPKWISDSEIKFTKRIMLDMDEYKEEIGSIKKNNNNWLIK